MANIIHQSGDVTIYGAGNRLAVDVYIPFLDARLRGSSGGTERIITAQGFELESLEDKAQRAAEIFVSPSIRLMEQVAKRYGVELKPLSDAEKLEMQDSIRKDSARAILFNTLGAGHGEYYEVTPEAQAVIMKQRDNFSQVRLRYLGSDRPKTHRGVELVHG